MSAIYRIAHFWCKGLVTFNELNKVRVEVWIEVVKPEQLELLSERKNLWKWSNDQWRDKQLRIFWLFSVGWDQICGFKVFEVFTWFVRNSIYLGRWTWFGITRYLDFGEYLGSSILVDELKSLSEFVIVQSKHFEVC